MPDIHPTPAPGTSPSALLRRLAKGVLGRRYLPLAYAYRAYTTRAHLEGLSARPAAFDDRRQGHGTLLMILAGHKPGLWPQTMDRARRHTAREAVDVCIVCSGGAPAAAEARALAARNGWSFLQAREDLLAHVQNLAVQAFERATLIAKIDEDMFVTPGWLEALVATLAAVEREGAYRVGLVAPLIPVNGFGYRRFLELTAGLDAYRAAFPEHPPVSAGLGVGVHESADVAEWLWRRTAPLDERAQELGAHVGAYSVCPHRFSIGAFLMRRETLEAMGGFAVAPVPGLLGYEEALLCSWCMTESRAIVVAHGSLVGHFAFGPQWPRMAALLRSEPGLFA